jgi:hypothetical protein
MKQEIIVEIDATGAVNIDACGFTGGACEKATKVIEDALGPVVSEKKKPERFKPEPNQETQRT